MTNPVSYRNPTPALPPSRLPIPLFEILEQWLVFENNPEEAQESLNRAKERYNGQISPELYEAAQLMIDSHIKREPR